MTTLRSQGSARGARTPLDGVTRCTNSGTAIRALIWENGILGHPAARGSMSPDVLVMRRSGVRPSARGSGGSSGARPGNVGEPRRVHGSAVRIDDGSVNVPVDSLCSSARRHHRRQSATNQVRGCCDRSSRSAGISQGLFGDFQLCHRDFWGTLRRTEGEARDSAERRETPGQSRRAQHSMTLTARPPRAVFLYLTFMSAPSCVGLTVAPTEFGEHERQHPVGGRRH